MTCDWICDTASYMYAINIHGGKSNVGPTSQNQLSGTKFDSACCIHPIATSLNNVDSLQFWNCSLNTCFGFIMVYQYISQNVTNNNFWVMLVWCVHGLQVPAESLWYFMFTPHNFRAKEKAWKLWASTCRSTYTHQTATKPCYYYCLTKNIFGWSLDVSKPFRVRPGRRRQIVTNSFSLKFRCSSSSLRWNHCAAC